MGRTIEQIREAFSRMHAFAIGRRGQPYMSVPADPKRDADIILSDAIDELAAARRVVEAVDALLVPGRQPFGHDRSTALAGGCVCRWCDLHRALAAYDEATKGTREG